MKILLIAILFYIFTLSETKKSKKCFERYKWFYSEKQGQNQQDEETVTPRNNNNDEQKSERKQKKNKQKIKKQKKKKIVENQEDQNMDEYEDYEYQTIHNLDPDSLNLSFYSDKYIFNKIFVFGTFFNIVLWVCGCVFCGPCFVVLCQIWLITRAFDSSAILGICVLACCCGNQNRISSARNNVQLKWKNRNQLHHTSIYND